MAVQTFEPEKPTTLGKKLTKHTGLSAADTFKFKNDGKTKILVTAKATETKVKVAISAKTDGQPTTIREVACKEGEFAIGPFPLTTYNNEEEFVEFTMTSAAEIEVAILKG